ncbi:LysR family transcriptional regulator [Halomonas salifodinae]|uniref:LysR substrate-binding domain-containing protein n=1 Tax=Halomonas salifodinae TaxID=438745 RepID=UPI0033B7A83D
MDRIDTLRTFLRVAEMRSFTKAAASLQMPRSTVSTAIQELEARLGTRLLSRTTRHVALTHDGKELYDRALRLLGELEALEGLFHQDDTQLHGRLRIEAPGRIARLIIVPALPDFFARYPGIELEIGASDRPVNLVTEGVDCAIRVGELAESSLIARPLGRLPLINCASPDYLARHGTPTTLDDLCHHQAIHYASPFGSIAEDWEYREAGESRTLSLPSRVIVDNAESYIAACLAGLGLIQVPTYDVQHHLREERLVEVLPDHRAAPMPLTILYPHRHHRSRLLRVFIAWVETLLSQEIQGLSSPMALSS